ncbi:MAG: glycosyltransferase family 2 protein [Gemmatimonadota bacterium]
MSDDPTISVLVATRNRAASLVGLLEAIESQADAPTFEVIVCDNGSTDETPRLLETWAARISLHSLRVDATGKGRALNAGIGAARGELLVFTDDDARPRADWLREIEAGARRHPDVSIFGGTIEVDPDSVPRWIRESSSLMGLLTSEHDWTQEDAPYPFGAYPFGPNMAVRRTLIASAADPYPTDMGPGTSLPVGDESAFLRRFSDPVARDRFCLPRARVRHDVEAENVTLGSALRRSFQAGRANRWNRIPMYEVGSGTGPRLTLWGRVRRRISASRSVREFACLCARYLGYLTGSSDRSG